MMITSLGPFQSSWFRVVWPLQVMKRLSHPNIIRCYGYFWEFPTQSLYIVLERPGHEWGKL